MKKNVALCGFGRMGQLHCKNLLAHENVELKYIFDPKAEQKNFCGVEIVQDLDPILRDESVDHCVIAAPTQMHVEVIKSLGQYKKNIFCEKPVSTNLAALDDLKQFIESEQINFVIGFNRRFDPGFLQLREQVLQNQIGPIMSVKIVNRDPLRPAPDFVGQSGGLFFDFNTHDFDAIKFICGLEIKEIFAQGAALIDPSLKKFGDIDSTLISARLSNNAHCLIDCSRETKYGYDQRIEIFGEKGMLELTNCFETQVSALNEKGICSDAIEYSFAERYRQSYCDQLNAFLFDQEKNIAATIEDGIYAARIALCAQKSLAQGRNCLV